MGTVAENREFLMCRPKISSPETRAHQQELSLGPWASSGSLWVHFWITLVAFRSRFENNFGSFWYPFGVNQMYSALVG